MKTYCNYILTFSDGSVKVGVTSRPQARVSEICRSKRGAELLQGVHTPLCTKDDAFQIEARLCSLFAHQALDGTREWFTGGIREFNFLRQATGMFWQTICNKGQRAEMEYSEAAA